VKNSLWEFATAAIVLTLLAPGLVMLLAGCGPEVTPTPAPAAPPTDTPVLSPALSQVEGKVKGEAERMVPLPMAMSPSQARLTDVTRWFYMIDANLEPEMVERIAASEYDMVVLDFIPSEENNAGYPMADVIAQLHNPSHHFDCTQCKSKLVIAYIDIGQAEEYRTYWQPGWGIGHPEWIVGTDPDGWEGNFPVAYWYDEWREIWLGEDGYLQAILDAGFDGVYLDWVEAYSDENVIAMAEQDGVDPRQEMIWWIGDMADFARDQRPDFVVIAQNAAELAEDDDYLAIIDAISQEQVWFDGGADNEPPGDCPLPRTEAEVDSEAYRQSLSSPCRKQYDDYPDSTLHVSSEEYLHYLTQARDKGEIIFTVDYALEPDNVAWVYETSRALGFVPFVSNRGLDRYVEPVP
jgi:cysteinyl-tRNA synthetase